MLKLKNLSRHPLDIPVDLKDMLRMYKSLILAGGAIRDSLNGREIADYDFFFTDLTTKDRVREYLVDNGYSLVFACPLGHLYSYKKDDLKVQLITKMAYGTIENLLNSFDFTICQFAYNHEGVVYTNKQAIKDNKTNTLTVHEVTFPTSTINRISKYKAKGFWTGDAIKSIVEHLVQMDVRDYNPEDDSLYVD